MYKKLRRSRKHRLLAGVASGIAEYLNIPIWLSRLVWLILLFPGGFPGLIPYIVCWIFIPKEDFPKLENY